MKKIFSIYIALATLAGIAFASCTDDDPITVTAEILKADFSYQIFDKKVVFTDKSEYATEYFWNFGDGETSTEVNPTHTYKEGGSITVELTVKNALRDSQSASRKFKVDGKSPEGGLETDFEIILDGNFDDWNKVPKANLVKSVLNEEVTKLKKIKEARFCSNGKYLYMYAKIDKTDANSLDMYIDVDGDPMKGYTNWQWLDMSASYLMQGGFADNYEMSLFAHDKSAGNGWGWKDEVGGAFEISEIKASAGNIIEFEARILLSHFKGIGKELRIGLSHSGTAADEWADSGALPTVADEGDKLEPIAVPIP